MSNKGWFAIVRSSRGEIKVLAGPYPSRKVCLFYANTHIAVEGVDYFVIECCTAKRYAQVVDEMLAMMKEE